MIENKDLISVEYLKSKTITDSDGCWIWKESKKKGYGTISISNKSQAVHRVIFELVFGAIEDGLFVLHKCDKPSCINPKHLFSGTSKDNSQDMVNKGRCQKHRKGIPKIHSENALQKMRLAATGRLHTKETKLKMSAVAMGNKKQLGLVRSEAHKQALKEAWVKRKMKPFED